MSSTDEKIINFIDFVYPAANDVCNYYKLPILFCLAQTALETGWGANAPGNNYFGIKAGSKWTGDTLSRKDGIFRAYPSIVNSFDDWGKLLTTEYKNALQYRGDPVLFAQAIKAGGYAEDPDYLAKIVSVMDSIKKRFPDIENVSGSSLNWLVIALIGGCLGYYLIKRR